MSGAVRWRVVQRTRQNAGMTYPGPSKTMTLAVVSLAYPRELASGRERRDCRSAPAPAAAAVARRCRRRSPVRAGNDGMGSCMLEASCSWRAAQQSMRALSPACGKSDRRRNAAVAAPPLRYRACSAEQRYKTSRGPLSRHFALRSIALPPVACQSLDINHLTYAAVLA